MSTDNGAAAPRVAEDKHIVENTKVFLGMLRDEGVDRADLAVAGNLALGIYQVKTDAESKLLGNLTGLTRHTSGGGVGY